MSHSTFQPSRCRVTVMVQSKSSLSERVKPNCQGPCFPLPPPLECPCAARCSPSPRLCKVEPGFALGLPVQ